MERKSRKSILRACGVMLLALAPAGLRAVGTIETRGLFSSLRPSSSLGLASSWQGGIPLKLSWDFGRWAEADLAWGWGGGGFHTQPDQGRRNISGALPLSLGLRAKAGDPEGSWVTGMLGFASAGDLALIRGLAAASAVPESRPGEDLYGGGRKLRMEAGAESRLGRGRWRITLWSEDEGSYPAEGADQRLDPGTAGGIRLQGRLGRDREEKVALTLDLERKPSYRETGPSGSTLIFKPHGRQELRLEGWTNIGRRLGLGLILMESDRSGVELPLSRGTIPALWPLFRTGPTVDAVLGLRHWMPGDANAFYSGGLFRAAANGAPRNTDIRDEGYRGGFLAAEAEAALTKNTGAGWKISWTRTKDLGPAPDSLMGEEGRVRSALRLELLFYRVL